MQSGEIQHSTLKAMDTYKRKRSLLYIREECAKYQRARQKGIKVDL